LAKLDKYNLKTSKNMKILHVEDKDWSNVVNDIFVYCSYINASKTIFPLRFIYEKESCTLKTDSSDILSLKPKCIIPKIITNENFESITYSELYLITCTFNLTPYEYIGNNDTLKKEFGITSYFFSNNSNITDINYKKITFNIKC
jgi:hypothetical protein